MANIVRGHSFDLTDIANAQALNDLVERAQIGGLAVGDLPNSGVQVSVFSAASGATYGWISAQYDPLRISTHASVAEFNYVLTTPNGQVSLFKPYGLETRRFFNVEDLYLTGSAFLIKNIGAPSVTLRCTIGYSAGVHRADFLGCNYGTAPSGFAPRLTIKGLAGGHVVDAGGTPPLRHYWHLFNASGGQWQHSAGATDTDKVAAMTLDHRLTGVDATMPAYFFGGPVWRA